MFHIKELQNDRIVFYAHCAVCIFLIVTSEGHKNKRIQKMKRKAKESIARAVKKAGVQPPPKSKEATTVITPEAAKKASQSPSIIERTPLVPRTHSSAVNEHLCNIMCWNVAGLRGTLKNNKNIFDELVQVSMSLHN